MFPFNKNKQLQEQIKQLQKEIEELEAEKYRLRDLLSQEWQAKRRLMNQLNNKKKK